MNDWWKLALGGAGAAGLLALTGGAAAPLLAGEGTAAGVGAGSAGAAAGTAEAAGAGIGTAGAEAGAGAVGAAAPSATAYVTPSIMGSSGQLAGVLSGTTLDYGTPAMLAESNAAAAATPAPGLLAQAGGYAKDAGKAAATYNAVSGAMGGNAPGRPAPMAQPIFQGQAAPITPQQTQASSGQANQFMQLLEQQKMRQRGLMG